MKILIVDDEIFSRNKLQKLMAKIGECVTVENEEKAFQLFQEALNKGKPFDLVIKRLFLNLIETLKILIADDEMVSRGKMQRLMDKVGECFAVESGKEAIQVFKRAFEEGQPFHLVMLDIVMPEMDGIETLTKIRAFEEEKNVPKEKMVKVIMVTAYSDKKTILECMRAGCDDYIKKPFKKEMIIKKMVKQGLIKIK
jgi:two-component system chemotaxis response regulator CheY